MRAALSLLLLAACGNPPTECVEGFEAGDGGYCYEIDDSQCAEGFHLDDDGMCYPDETDGNTVEAAMAEWPDCILEKGDGRIDLDFGCADDVCVGRNYGEIAELMGEGDCYFYQGYGYGYCTWGGAGGYFLDADDDLLPDEFYYLSYVMIVPGYTGHTELGAGPNLSMSCWTETEGDPDAVEFSVGYTGEYQIGQITYYSPGTVIYDAVGADYSYESDGRSDYIYLYGG